MKTWMKLCLAGTIILTILAEPTTECPVCHYQMDAATPTPLSGDVRPRAGDISLCARCGEILEFDAQLVPRVPTLASIMEWPKEQTREVERLQKIIRQKRLIK